MLSRRDLFASAGVAKVGMGKDGPTQTIAGEGKPPNLIIPLHSGWGIGAQFPVMDQDIPITGVGNGRGLRSGLGLRPPSAGKQQAGQKHPRQGR